MATFQLDKVWNGRPFCRRFSAASIVAPSGREDLVNAEFRPLIDRYYRGTGTSAIERVKLYKVVWNAFGTQFGGRYKLYERNDAGNHEKSRVDALNCARRTGAVDECLRLADRRLADHDLEGWTSQIWR